MSGGVPGAYPKFADAGVPHPVPLNLFDPLGTSKKASPEKKAKGLIAEMNNGRLAMIGLMAFLSEVRPPAAYRDLPRLASTPPPPMPACMPGRPASRARSPASRAWSPRMTVRSWRPSRQLMPACPS